MESAISESVKINFVMNHVEYNILPMKLIFSLLQ
jgi:hypothetical protein